MQRIVWGPFDYITVRVNSDRLTEAALIQDVWMLELSFVCLFGFAQDLAVGFSRNPKVIYSVSNYKSSLLLSRYFVSTLC